jgi:hypothetical protein
VPSAPPAWAERVDGGTLDGRREDLPRLGRFSWSWLVRIIREAMRAGERMIRSGAVGMSLGIVVHRAQGVQQWWLWSGPSRWRHGIEA